MSSEPVLERKVVAMELMVSHRRCPYVGFFPSASALPPGWYASIQRELREREAGRGLPACCVRSAHRG